MRTYTHLLFQQPFRFVIYICMSGLLLCGGRLKAQSLVQTFGGLSIDQAHGIATLPDGAIAVVGQFAGDVDFDYTAGQTVLNGTTNGTAFLAVYEPDGRLRWARNWGSVANTTTARRVAVDPNTRGFYILGSFFGTADMDPSTLASGLAPLTSIGGDDIYLLALDAAGNYRWARHIGSPTTDRPLALTISHNGDVLVGGSCQNNVRFLPSAMIFPVQGGNDAFVARYGADGVFKWAEVLGGSGDDAINGLATNNNDDVVALGTWQNSMDIIPGTGEFIVSSQGADDLFALALDSAGSYRWASLVQGAGGCAAAHLVQNPTTGDILALASLQSGTVDADPGPATLSLTVDGSEGMLLWALDGAGNLRWAHTLQDISALATPQSLALQANDDVLVVGQLLGTMDADPDTTATLLLDGGTNGAAVLAAYDIAGRALWGRTLGTVNTDSSQSFALSAAAAPSGDAYYVAGYFYGPVDFGDAASPALVLRSVAGSADAYWLKLNASDGSTGSPVAGLLWQDASTPATLSAYPNPSKGLLLIDFQDIMSDFQHQNELTAQLFDAQGSLVMQLRFAAHELAAGWVQADLSALPAGVYLLHVAGAAPLRILRVE